MPKTGVVKEARFMDHHMGAHHPESPQRLKVIYDMLDESGEISYRSTEYTLIVGKKLCTIQFTTLNSDIRTLSKSAADNALSEVYSSLKIKTM